jgi:hypothetical protein
MLAISKDLEVTFMRAILKYFYTQKLLTEIEYIRIIDDLESGNKYVDNNTGKSDVYV